MCMFFRAVCATIMALLSPLATASEMIAVERLAHPLARWNAIHRQWLTKHAPPLRNIRACGNYIFTAEMDIGGVSRKDGGIAEMVLRGSGLRIWPLPDGEQANARRYYPGYGASGDGGYVIGLPLAEFERFRFSCLKFDSGRATAERRGFMAEPRSPLASLSKEATSGTYSCRFFVLWLFNVDAPTYFLFMNRLCYIFSGRTLLKEAL